MKIGQMKSKDTASGQILEGAISTLENDISFFAVKLPAATNPNAPSHKLCAWNRNGAEVQIGSAWTKAVKSAERYGDEFLTLTFDDPSFEKPLNVAAFKNAETGDWDIMFRRRQSRAA